MPVPENPPPTFEPLEYPSAAKLNEIRDWIDALNSVTLITDENNFTSTRQSDEYGPMDEGTGPEVTFKAGPDGKVMLFIYAWIRTTISGTFAHASYEIERVSDNETVVGPSDLRSIMARDGIASSRQHVWREHLVPGETYVARMVYRADSNDPEDNPTVDCRFTKLIVDRVFQP